MKGLQSFQGLRPLDPYQGPALDLLGGLQHPQTPAVSGNDRWSLHITPLTQCEYSVIIRDMDFFLPSTDGTPTFLEIFVDGTRTFSMGLSHRTPVPYSR